MGKSDNIKANTSLKTFATNWTSGLTSKVKTKAKDIKITRIGKDTLSSAIDKITPSDKQKEAARSRLDAKKPFTLIPGERFGAVKVGLHKLWTNKFTIIGSAALAGAAATAFFTHSQWLPQALHLATSPIGIGVLAGLGALALVGLSFYAAANLMSRVKHVQADQARKMAKEEQQNENLANLPVPNGGDQKVGKKRKVAPSAAPQQQKAVLPKTLSRQNSAPALSTTSSEDISENAGALLRSETARPSLDGFAGQRNALSELDQRVQGEDDLDRLARKSPRSQVLTSAFLSLADKEAATSRFAS